jgi:hypothetical protein
VTWLHFTTIVISLEGNVHSLADANSLLAIYTGVPAARPALLATGKGGKRTQQFETDGYHSAATIAAGLARRLALRGCRSISISASACGIPKQISPSEIVDSISD